MPVGISNLAYSVRKNSSTDTVSVSLGHAHQLVAAALGYRTLASYQAAKAAGNEPPSFDDVCHVILDDDLLCGRARELGTLIPAVRLRQLLEAAFSDRLPSARLHSGYGSLEHFLRDRVDQAVLDDDAVINPALKYAHCAAYAAAGCSK